MLHEPREDDLVMRLRRFKLASNAKATKTTIRKPGAAI